MTVEAVAARAGAGKATVYRRWANKAALLADALAHERARTEIPDTGSLREDLLALSEQLFGGGGSAALYRVRLVTGMVSAMLADPELRRASEEVVSPPRRALEAIIAQAVARGEILAPHDTELEVAVLPALALHRLIFTGVSPDPGFATRVIEHIVLPTLRARSAPPRPHDAKSLKELSRRGRG